MALAAACTARQFATLRASIAMMAVSKTATNWLSPSSSRHPGGATRTTLAVARGRTDHREVLPQREPAHRTPSTRNSVRSLIANDELRSALDTSILLSVATEPYVPKSEPPEQFAICQAHSRQAQNVANRDNFEASEVQLPTAGGDEVVQLLFFKTGKQVIDSPVRPFTASPGHNCCEHIPDLLGIQPQHVEKKLVRGLSEQCTRKCRIIEVLEVERDDDVCAPHESSCDDVSVTRVDMLGTKGKRVSQPYTWASGSARFIRRRSRLT